MRIGAAVVGEEEGRVSRRVRRLSRRVQGFGVCRVDSLAQVDYDHCVLVPEHVVLAQIWGGRRAMEVSGVGCVKV